MDDIYCISPEELVILATILALTIAKDKTTNEINVLGNFITAIGCILLALASQKQSLQDLAEKCQEIQNSKCPNDN